MVEERFLNFCCHAIIGDVDEFGYLWRKNEFGILRIKLRRGKLEEIYRAHFCETPTETSLTSPQTRSFKAETLQHLNSEQRRRQTQEIQQTITKLNQLG